MSKREDLSRLLAEAKAHLDAYEEHVRALEAAGEAPAAVRPGQENEAGEGGVELSDR